MTFRLYNGPEGAFSADEGATFNGQSITLGHVPIVPGSETVKSADGAITYSRGIAYSIDYAQGVITRIGANLPDGTYVLVQYKYTSGLLWSEEQTVTVANGLFTVALGESNPFGPSFSFDRPLYLGIQVGEDPEMTPRMRLGSVPSALNVADGAVTSAKLASDAAGLSRVSGGAMASSENGNVGIGTSAPASPLHIQTPINVPAHLRLRSGGSWPLLMSQDPESVFTITNGGNVRLTLTPGGSLGVGTGSPGARLDVAGMVRSTSGGFRFPDGTTQTSSADGKSWLLGGNAGTTPTTQFLGTTDGQPLVFKTNGMEAIRVTPNGRVGVNTPAPLADLHVSGAENDGTTAAVRISSGGQNLLLDGNEIDADFSGLYLNHNNTGNVIVATGGGRVGIGTASPASPLHVQTPAGVSAQIRLRNGTSWSGIIAQTPENKLVLNNGGEDRVTVMTNGNVGVGTANPGARLEVSGDTRVSGRMRKTYDSGATFSDITPVAMAFISGAGTVLRGTPNLSSVWDATNSRYQITINGVNFDSRDYEYIIMISNYTGNRYSIGSIGGSILVSFGDSLNSKDNFSIVVYKP